MKQGIGKQTLRNRLPAASDESLDALLSMLRQGGGTSSAPFTALLQEDCSPAMIQSTLNEHRDELLGDGSLNADEVQAAIRQCDRLGLLLLQAVAKAWQAKVSELESRLSHAGSELEKAATRLRWVREGEVTLYNYFHEVPIMARVAVHNVRESGFGVDRSSDLVRVVAAGQHGRFAHIRLPDLASCLRLEVESVVGKHVNFRYAGAFETAKERRQHIRVQCGDVLHMTLSGASGQIIETAVRDISESGFGLNILRGGEVLNGETYAFDLSLQTGELKGSCQVRWLDRAGGKSTPDKADHGRCGVEIDLRPALLRRLQIEVSQRKKRILNELRALGTPDSLS
ncbi:MAG: hypothetical protein COW19_08610 [Zetaproteobacteria bacterium CG12_big_fil_rev_8_21_14_0_65_55_1124]|nr:MAG: hypothetical protein AUJ58_03415 [Zetaproteobacteria bacterium CG1_02_55_237]PIS19519.1 MAG: hypothetical protein COT53_04820 [Zetaproteobacteria bacterium CG08_land_8_20_14_0_20_55_17]PIW42379.1 MAG: hypothetical protein COW19_08610 [Zetaproteobacteria bacterium CG12_big_fil_rev_8_21_14_0_65_55_1124]PIY52819.1 MAG: hypothetical protein COZ01_06060 [Zetaproteobacteria bacterium CG_4_10_14_0_8_um_filter_55_43]PIZ38025.1 MAG: hypothetical protein COY36_07365 [Zetaproteobacteria bacterium 